MFRISFICESKDLNRVFTIYKRCKIREMDEVSGIEIDVITRYCGDIFFSCILTYLIAVREVVEE